MDFQLVPQLCQLLRRLGDEPDMGFGLLVYFLILLELAEFQDLAAEFPRRLGAGQGQ